MKVETLKERDIPGRSGLSARYAGQTPYYIYAEAFYDGVTARCGHKKVISEERRIGLLYQQVYTFFGRS